MTEETNTAMPQSGTDDASSKPAETVSEVHAADTMDEGPEEADAEGKTDIKVVTAILPIAP